MRLRTIILTFSIVMVALLAALWVSLAGRGFSAKEKPSWLEEFLARNARNIATPAGAKELKNPVPATEENLASARAHWVDHCALCHGLDGGADTSIGHNLYPPAPDMRDAQTQELSDGELYYIISHGVRLTGMPAWGGLHSEEETWQLVSFIRRLPHLTEQERKQMQELAGGEGDNHPGGGHQHGPGTRPHAD